MRYVRSDSSLCSVNARHSELTDDQVEHIDQMVYRFAKLFALMVAVLREDSVSLTIFDVLAELEKAGALPIADRWVALREIRNQLAHDYQDDPEEGSRYLNELYAAVDDLYKAADLIMRFVRERVLPSLPGTR